MRAIVYGYRFAGEQDAGESSAGMEAFEAALRSMERRLPEEYAAVGIYVSRSDGEQFYFSENMVCLMLSPTMMLT